MTKQTATLKVNTWLLHKPDVKALEKTVRAGEVFEVEKKKGNFLQLDNGLYLHNNKKQVTIHKEEAEEAPEDKVSEQEEELEKESIN